MIKNIFDSLTEDQKRTIVGALEFELSHTQEQLEMYQNYMPKSQKIIQSQEDIQQLEELIAILTEAFNLD